MARHLWTITGLSLAALAIAACGNETPEPAETPAAPEAATPAAPAEPTPDYSSLLTAPDRLVADAARDAQRKPGEVLAFSNIAPGQVVFEMEAGGGYYTDLLSRAVGADGKVIMQQPKEFETFYKDDIAARTGDNRLPNVTISFSTFDALDAADGSVDVVTWFQGPHELYCKEGCNNIPMGDPVKAYAEIFRILKPGGYFIVMDHVAPQGSPTTTGNDLHRIDPLQVKASATTAGFILEEESKLLANPSDDYAKDVFDETVRGKTDQFLLRYVKPG